MAVLERFDHEQAAVVPKRWIRMHWPLWLQMLPMQPMVDYFSPDPLSLELPLVEYVLELTLSRLVDLIASKLLSELSKAAFRSWMEIEAAEWARSLRAAQEPMY